MMYAASAADTVAALVLHVADDVVQKADHRAGAIPAAKPAFRYRAAG